MTGKWTTKYGLAAVLTAILIISVALFANPNILPKQVSGKSSFAVMLTDPPNVPAGTSLLNLTYSDIALDIVSADGTSNWVSVGGSGTVDLFSLVNMSQTIASTTIPTNTTVDKIQFTITNVTAVINDQTYNVTTLSNTLVMSIANSQVNQTLSGVLIDFNPTLLQIQSTDANGNPVNYYVLVPSATAVVVNGIDQAQIRVGTIVGIGQNARLGITRVTENFSQNLTITSASLSVEGNTTNLSVTLQNNGDVTFRIFGLTLQGQLNSTLNPEAQILMPGNDHLHFGGPMMNSIPFSINDTSLVPLLGPDMQMQPMMPQQIFHGPLIGMGKMGHMDQDPQPFGPQNGMHDDRTGAATGTYLVLDAGQTVTLSFSGVVGQNEIFAQSPSNVITPIVGNSYTVSLMGEGFQTFNVTATA